MTQLVSEHLLRDGTAAGHGTFVWVSRQRGRRTVGRFCCVSRQRGRGTFVGVSRRQRESVRLCERAHVAVLCETVGRRPDSGTDAVCGVREGYED